MKYKNFNIKKIFKIILLFGIFINPIFFLFSTPYQLISNESAFIIKKNNLEIKEDIIYSESYVKDWGIRSQLRLGLFERTEFSMASSFNYFPGLKGADSLLLEHYDRRGYDFENLKIDNPRIAYLEPKLKIQVSEKYDLVSYLKYKYYFGIPIVLPYPENGKDPDAIGMVATNASQGQDIFLGLITKRIYQKYAHETFALMGGIEAVYLHDKLWQENWRKGSYMAAATFAPEVILYDVVMFQIENRFEYWFKRGWRYEIMPGIRWEVEPRTIVELGVGFPILGGNIKRYVLGFTYEFGESFRK
ncbi:MAG: hypothetical protein OEZ22_04140 [Spirochaetia bacterium]|nr:hypothetical protein [Spirochaetia bacterium]